MKAPIVVTLIKNLYLRIDTTVLTVTSVSMIKHKFLINDMDVLIIISNYWRRRN